MSKEIYLKRLEEIITNGKAVPVPSKDYIFYLVNEDMIKELLKLEKDIGVSGMFAVGKNEKNKKPSFDFFKIINGKYPAFKYEIVYIKRHVEIFDRTKVFEALPAKLSIWIKARKRSFNEWYEANRDSVSLNLIEEEERKLKDDIEITKETIEKIKTNFDDYEVVISTYERAKDYPTCIFTCSIDEVNKQTNSHLREGVPNFLWYDPSAKKKHMSRADSKITKIIEDYNNIGDLIYYKKI